MATQPKKAAEPGIGLCLSGGGYRAMVFHIGVLWRLYEAGVLTTVKRVSSVSGGSITAGVLALAWKHVAANPPRMDAFDRHVVQPLRGLARKTIDKKSVIGGLLRPFTTISELVSKAYDEHLFHGATLQDLPDEPRFVINATSVQSTVLWRFEKPYMRDYRVGEVKNPRVRLCDAVTASSAFPPVLSPFRMTLDPASFTPKDPDDDAQDLHREPYTRDVVLTDGGVYDNMGLETVWERLDTVLVSDAGGKTQPEGDPKGDWARHAYRVLDLVDNQVRSLRKREIIDAFKYDGHKGAYWGIRTNIKDYELPNALPCPHDRTTALAQTPTRLAEMPDLLQERLVNWGYAVCDAAMRKHVVTTLAPPSGFPYPQAGV
jgi:NTE family protein